MNTILFADDDEVILGLYQKALTLRGFKVRKATDGISAIQALRTERPDAVVLDLMMPRFGGVDVLKFIRSDAALRNLPVIVLTNAYLNDLVEQASRSGVQETLIKTRCTPAVLADAIRRAIDGQGGAGATQEAARTAGDGEAGDLMAATGNRLQANAAKMSADLQVKSKEFLRAAGGAERDLRLQNFYQHVGFLASASGLADSRDIAMVASAFEALLFELIHRPELITPSVRRTVSFTVDFLVQMLGRMGETPPPAARDIRVLVVDDDPLSNRLITAALRRAQLESQSTEDSAVALQWAKEREYSLFLLDIEMPGMDGLELCRRLRAMPAYQRTPVIFVTGHSDFENRAQSIIIGADDLISKPVLPIELAVKAVTHLLKG